MIEYFKSISLALVFGFVLTGISFFFKSSYLSHFFDTNLIMLLIALLAINITTLSILAIKLKEMAEKHHTSFPNPIAEMKVSVYEQISLIFVALILLMIKTSNLLPITNRINFCLDVLLSAVFVYAIYILYDTANAVFVIMQNGE